MVYRRGPVRAPTGLKRGPVRAPTGFNEGSRPLTAEFRVEGQSLGHNS